MCPYAELMGDGIYRCGLDGGECDEGETGTPCDTALEYIESGDDVDYDYLDMPF